MNEIIISSIKMFEPTSVTGPNRIFGADFRSECFAEPMKRSRTNSVLDRGRPFSYKMEVLNENEIKF